MSASMLPRAVGTPASYEHPLPDPACRAVMSRHRRVAASLLALTLGRISRYMLLAYLAALYGRHIIAFIAGHGHPVAVAILLLLVATAAALYYFWGGSKRRGRA